MLRFSLWFLCLAKNRAMGRVSKEKKRYLAYSALIARLHCLCLMKEVLLCLIEQEFL